MFFLLTSFLKSTNRGSIFLGLILSSIFAYSELASVFLGSTGLNGGFSNFTFLLSPLSDLTIK